MEALAEGRQVSINYDDGHLQIREGTHVRAGNQAILYDNREEVKAGSSHQNTGPFVFELGSSIYEIESASRVDYNSNTGQFVIQEALVKGPDGRMYKADIVGKSSFLEKDEFGIHSIKADPEDVAVQIYQSKETPMVAEFGLTPDKALALAHDPARLTEELKRRAGDDPFVQRAYMTQFALNLAQGIAQEYGKVEWHESVQDGHKERSTTSVGIQGTVSASGSAGFAQKGEPGYAGFLNLPTKALSFLFAKGGSAKVGAKAQIFAKHQKDFIHEHGFQDAGNRLFNVVAPVVLDTLEKGFDKYKDAINEGKSPEEAQTYLKVAASRISRITHNFERSAKEAYENVIEREKDEHQYGQFGKPRTEEVLGDTAPVIHSPEGPVDVRTGKDPTRVEHVPLDNLSPEELDQAVKQGWVWGEPVETQEENKSDLTEGAKKALHDFGEGFKKAGEDLSDGAKDFMSEKQNKNS